MQKITRSAALIVIASLSLSLAAAEKEENVPRNAIYKSCGHYLFEQNSLTNRQAYLQASREQKENMLEDEFNRRRRICYASELVNSGVVLVPTLLAFYWGYKKINNPTQAAMGMGGGIMMLGAAQVFGSLIGSLGSKVTTKLNDATSIAYNLFFPEGSEAMEKYEIRYVRQKPFIKKELQEIIEENFISSRTGVDDFSSFGRGYGQEQKKSPVEFARVVLDLPKENVEVKYEPKKINDNLGTFSDEVLLQCKRFAVRHAAASTGGTVRKIVAYFEGPPGVGKTKAAEAIADALGVPFYVIKLAGKTVQDLEGTATEPGLLLQAMLKAKRKGKNAKNMIIFFDEIDRALGLTPGEEIHGFNRGSEDSGFASNRFSNQQADSGMVPFLLTLFEAGQKTFPSPYLGIDVDISDLGILAAGNYNMTIDALKSRFEHVEFNGYDAKFKKKIVQESLFDELLEPHLSSKIPLDRLDFNRVDWMRVNEMIEGDTDPGFRSVIKFLQNLMGDKVLCKYYSEQCYNHASQCPISKPAKCYLSERFMVTDRRL